MGNAQAATDAEYYRWAQDINKREKDFPKDMYDMDVLVSYIFNSVTNLSKDYAIYYVISLGRDSNGMIPMYRDKKNILYRWSATQFVHESY